MLLSKLFVLLFSYMLSSHLYGIEELKYYKIKSYEKFEIRYYPIHLVATIKLKGSFDEVGNQGFKALLNYIQGDNSSYQTKLDSAEGAKGRSIDMTSPVNQISLALQDTYEVSFIMPSQYSLNTLPVPKDPRIKLRTVPGSFRVVRRYADSWDQKHYIYHRKILVDAVKEKGFTLLSKDTFARYNAPFVPWFLKRNEVMFKIKPIEEWRQLVKTKMN